MTLFQCTVLFESFKDTLFNFIFATIRVSVYGQPYQLMRCAVSLLSRALEKTLYLVKKWLRELSPFSNNFFQCMYMFLQIWIKIGFFYKILKLLNLKTLSAWAIIIHGAINAYKMQQILLAILDRKFEVLQNHVELSSCNYQEGLLLYCLLRRKVQVKVLSFHPWSVLDIISKTPFSRNIV